MKHAYGFTLVELAIALMVIGLLIGGVLKGQELIENARITSTIRQIKAYDAAALIFRNTYGAIPADIKRPNRIPNCVDPDKICDRGGNGDGKIYYVGNVDRYEAYNFFTHLTKAGLIQGPEGGTADEFEMTNGDMTMAENEKFFPTIAIDSAYHEYDRWIRVEYDNVLKNYYSLFSISTKAAAAIDGKIDDGMPRKGDVMADQISGGCYTSDDYPNNEYLPNDTEGWCRLYVGAEF